MIEWLIIGGGVVAAYAARKTPAVKAATKTVKDKFVGSKVGKGMVLSQAEENIVNELINLKREIAQEKSAIELDQKKQNKRQQELDFLDFALNKDDITPEEKEEYLVEHRRITAEYEVAENALEKRQEILAQKEEELSDYEKSGKYTDRIIEAHRAKVTFESQNQVDSAEKKMQKVLSLGESGMTVDAVNSVGGYAGATNVKRTPNRRKLLEEYRKSQKATGEK